MGTPSQPSRTAKTVLIVDDEEDILESLASLFEAAIPDIEVTTATSGPEALDFLRQRPVDLIISDYKMPSMNGVEFLSEAERLHPETPRLMITAYPDPDLAAQAVRKAHVALLISKPFDLNYFVDVVRAVLKRNAP